VHYGVVMGGKRAKRLRAARLAEQATKRTRARKALLLVTTMAVIASIAVGYLALSREERDSSIAETAAASGGVAVPHKVVRSAKTLDELLCLPIEKLTDVDIAEMNLLCAVGLPGAEKLDVDHALATLDRWAARVALETDRHVYRVHDPKWAGGYRHSEAYLRATFLVQVLYEDLGVRYDLAVKDNFDFDDCRVAFIHGMIPAPGQALTDTPGGTCASMPVMVTAVGRRLGYPLRLVTTKGHVFVRWDGQGHAKPAWRERFNMEVTNGLSSFEDGYYKTWPFKLSDREVRANRYLVSLTPAEEFAEFLAARGHCGLDNGQIAFAARCYENAYRYDTTRPAYRAWLLDAAMSSGYRPVTPALAGALTRRMRLAAARRDPTAMPKPSEMAAAAAASGLPSVAPRRTGWRRRPQRMASGVPQPPSPHDPGLPQAGAPRPGVPNPYQPYRPPVPGRPPR